MAPMDQKITLINNNDSFFHVEWADGRSDATTCYQAAFKGEINDY
jgi:hypothetical protein